MKRCVAAVQWRGLEEAEERLILRAARAGVVLDRRPDCDLDVLLTVFDGDAEVGAACSTA